MNIFLKVLKQLIGDELSSAAAKQKKKSQGYFTKHDLSVDQNRIITELIEKMIRFNSTDSDKVISEAVTKMLEDHCEQVRIVRGEYKEDKDKGETISALRNLKAYVPEFYKKLENFKFNLLDRTYSETPEGIVYLHAALYLGEEIFDPKKIMDWTIRTEKETCLCQRLQSLSELIKPEYGFEDRKSRTMNVLKDLANDNGQIIEKANASNYVSIPLIPVGGLSVFNTKVNLSDKVGYSLGRFSEQFNEAVRKINKMTPKTYDSGVLPHIETQDNLGIESKDNSDIENKEAVNTL